MKMKIIVAVIMAACAMAEPPVGDSYSYPDHSQRSLSQSYGVPSFDARNAQGYSTPSEQYGVPAQRSFKPKSVSQKYGPPKERSSLSQEYGAPVARSKQPSRQYIPARSQVLARTNTELSQVYGAPEARNVQDVSKEYGVPESRGLSDTITIPGVPSDSYGAPIRSAKPSEEYGVPQRGFQSFRSAVSPKYSAPRASSSTFNSYRPQSRKVSETYGAPAQTISSQYGVPKASQRTPSETYGVPNERALSSEYGVPSTLNTDAYVSSYESARSAPSQTYGLPARESMPSDQYGVPDLNSVLSSQGYNYARNALDELLNQEPANYDFGYKVNDLESGSDFGHTETRQENKAEGSYFVVLPDGSKQVVEYEADERGFKPRISVEPPQNKGYDDNASDLARFGPY